MKPLVGNAADENQVREASAKLKRGRDLELDDVRFILSHPQGRRFLWRYMSLCDRISADQSGSWTYFKEGERNIANKIKSDVVEANPDAFIQMMKEAKQEEIINV